MLKLAIAIFSLILVCAAAPAQTANPVAGHWQGRIQIPDHELQVTVDLDRNAKGAWVGSMSIAGTSSVDAPLRNLSVEGASVKFTANLGGSAAFTGKISDDGKSFSGTASNNEGEAPFQFTRSGEAAVKVPPPSSAMAKEFEGEWEGALDVNGNRLRIGMKLTAAADGSAAATLTSIDQGNAQFAADTVSINGKDLAFEIRGISGKYSGSLGANGEIAGEWAQGPGKLPLTFKRPAPKP